MTAILESLQFSVDQTTEDLRAALRADPHMLREHTEEAGRGFLLAIGQALIHGMDVGKLPEFDAQTIQNALRATGNYVLGQCGDDMVRYLANWHVDIKDSVDRHYAEDQACGLVTDLENQWYVERAAQAYLDALDEDDQHREPLERELAAFRDIREGYRLQLLKQPNGPKALVWAATYTQYVNNARLMLPAGVQVPWFHDANWYAQHGAQ